ncbi:MULTISPECIES: hypothetical protein [Tenacibaculum]|uniref:hypothetical protein n=1 Tax=Tenacibaculum TaxID=104267 RepID=UPI0008950762|nr:MULTISPECIES: hypothetical protein [unclassified Tenacibaculum]SEE67235.1 hypothetical protein SAMN04487765_3726 [Tenacibaculum sp. MAR_2010_89]
MLKNIKNLGSELNKTDQKSINGGKDTNPFTPCYCNGALIGLGLSPRDCYWKCMFTY